MRGEENQFHAIDLFSGQGSISRAYKARGENVARLDISLDKRDAPQQDLQSLSIGLDKGKPAPLRIYAALWVTSATSWPFSA